MIPIEPNEADIAEAERMMEKLVPKGKKLNLTGQLILKMATDLIATTRMLNEAHARIQELEGRCDHDWQNSSGEDRLNRYCPKCHHYEDELK